MKRLTICIPDQVIKDFKKVCKENYKSMSDSIRDFIREQIKKNDNNK